MPGRTAGLVLALCLAILPDAGATDALPGTLTLPAEIAIAADFVRLADLVGNDSCGTFGALALGRAPACGATRTLTRDDVLTALRRAAPAARLPELGGAATVLVRRAAAPASTVPAELAAAVAEAIRRWGPCAERALRAECTIDVQEVVPAGALSDAATLLPLVVAEGDAAGDPWSLRLLAISGSGARHELQVRARVRFEADALVARRPLRARQPLAAGDLEARRVELPPGARWFAPADLPHGRRLRHPLPAGTLLTEEALQPEIVVRTNDAVRVEVPGRGFSLRFDGVALQSGAAGEVIRIRNQDSKSVVRARIVAAGCAELIPGTREGGER